MTVESAKEYRQLAQKYRAFGFNLVPLGGNKLPVPTGKVLPDGKLGLFYWKDWQTTPQTDALWAQIKKHEWWVNVGGLGGICGPVSGYLICLDFDDTQFETITVFLDRMGLPSDYAWTVRTPGNGVHVWVRSHGFDIEKSVLKRVPINGVGIVELRWLGSIGVLPGSQHPDVPGVLYNWMYSEPSEGPAEVDRNLLLTVYMETTTEIKTPATVHTNGSAPYAPGQGYAAKALTEELQSVRTSAPHTHNDAVNKAAHSLGQLVGAGLLSESEVEAALLSAALDVGQGEGEALATIRSGLRSGIAKPRNVPLNGNGYTNGNSAEPYEYGFVSELPDELDLESLPTPQSRQHHTWPYTVKDGRMCLLYETRDGVESKPISDFTASIAEEIADEYGNVHLVIEGHGLRRGAFRCEISGQDFGSDVKLLGALTAATGGLDIVYSTMSPHLRPAIGKLTALDDRPQRIRYYRTGWEDDSYLSFLMPGMDDTTLISVPRQIAYESPKPGADLELGLLSLTNLIDAMKPTLTTPIIAALFMPPMLRPAGLGNERVAIFIAGRTGSLKTSWAQTAMCLYGPGFLSNDNLLKLGEGATRNAIMAFAAHAHDLPMLIDNYKPNTGNGKNDFVNLIHNILEGGDRKRSTRDGELRDTKLVRCIPVVTGEDLPRDDAASIARILLVTFEWQRGEPNDFLTAAQENSEHLCAVGWAWISWLKSEEGRAAVKATGKAFPRLRAEWAARLSHIEKDSANIARVASNLAVNQLAWDLACQHPAIGPALRSYSQAHTAGLRAIAHTMAKSTVEALEAHQYRNALRELLSIGQYKIIDRSVGKPNDYERDRVLGWFDSSGVYLVPAVALAAIKRLLGPTSLLISPQTLYGQMEQLGWLATTGGETTTKKISIGGDKVRVLHWLPNVLEDVNDDNTDSDEDDIALWETGL